uniref:Putative secreted peptide n=1 Tax=Anopheles braziliensis TaxID=58242 RepID=A0A2M3ZQ65_9DIPT
MIGTSSTGNVLLGTKAEVLLFVVFLLMTTGKAFLTLVIRLEDYNINDHIKFGGNPKQSPWTLPIGYISIIRVRLQISEHSQRSSAASFSSNTFEYNTKLHTRQMGRFNNKKKTCQLYLRALKMSTSTFYRITRLRRRISTM